MKKKPNVRVVMNYAWEFSSKDWDELQSCNKESQINNIKDKIEWDPISIFHHLNDMAYPNVRMSIENISEKSN